MQELWDQEYYQPDFRGRYGRLSNVFLRIQWVNQWQWMWKLIRGHKNVETPGTWNIWWGKPKFWVEPPEKTGHVGFNQQHFTEASKPSHLTTTCIGSCTHSYRIQFLLHCICFGLALVSSLFIPSFLDHEMGMFIMCHHVLEVFHFLFDFYWCSQ